MLRIVHLLKNGKQGKKISAMSYLARLLQDRTAKKIMKGPILGVLKRKIKVCRLPLGSSCSPESVSHKKALGGAFPWDGSRFHSSPTWKSEPNPIISFPRPHLLNLTLNQRGWEIYQAPLQPTQVPHNNPSPPSPPDSFSLLTEEYGNAVARELSQLSKIPLTVERNTHTQTHTHLVLSLLLPYCGRCRDSSQVPNWLGIKMCISAPPWRTAHSRALGGAC